MAFFKRKQAPKAQLGLCLSEDYGSAVVVAGAGTQQQRVVLAEAFVPREEATQELRGRLQKKRLTDSLVVGVGLPGQYALLQVEPPEVPEVELKDAIRWQVRDLVDFPVETALLDVFPVPELPQQRKLAYAATAPAKAFDPLVHLTEQLDVTCETIDIAELALTNILRHHPDQAQGVGGLYLNRTGGLLIIVRDGNLFFSRNISIGTDRLQMEADTGDALSLLVLELQRSLDFFEGSILRSQIRSVQVFPTEVELTGLSDQIDRQMTTHVETLNLFDLMEFETILDPAELYRCLIPLGAALRREDG